MPEVIALIIPPTLKTRIFDDGTLSRLEALGAVVGVPEGEALEPSVAAEMLAGARACITGWGSPTLDETVLAKAHALRFTAHAAGSVKALVTDTFWERGIRLASANTVMGEEVAWTTVASMVMARKNVFLLRDHLRKGGWGQLPDWPGGELHGSTIGIVGASQVGRHVLRILATVVARKLLYDPYVSATEASELGAEKIDDLGELIRLSDIVSVHAPNIPETRHMFNASNLALLRDGAIFINTARGALVDETALIDVLRTRRVFACIDVTVPEPPAADSPLRTLPNVLLTPHLAGMVGSGLRRLGEAAAEELRRFFAGEPLMNEITREMLPRLA